ncbi:aldehyde dehydrogenase family protein [Rhodococcus sp. H29-C3]|uniref:aldehyde dehydrogenase family protein n=1 Tax=Rhodococcus sp. H29-C3 TaxID=3046307 RepID=UPI0024BBDA06|nr:aldehyde dehydrogenase family protein [Rhodococcus sp. H29-C3]MDJ0361871.1 aldehyde dehydrogenase family protein [Rhodococcus sp. H29-C3]
MIVDFAARLAAASIPPLSTVVGGEFVDGTGDAFDSVYPGTGEVIATLRCTGEEQVDAAVAAALAAQPGWDSAGAEHRAQVLETTARSIVADVDRLATLVALDNGKPLADARGDVLGCAAMIRSAAGWATRTKGTTLPDEGGLLRLTWREPVGVVGVIMPFNAPLMFSGMKVAAAIAMGNSVVAKAPEKCPLAPVAFVEHLLAAGMPAGVVNVVQGFGPVGHRLVTAPDVRMVSFTGSNHVGNIVGAAATALGKRVLLELGGKSANIVYDDAPLDAAVAGSLAGIFTNAGQRCFSGSRILVQENIADEFIAALVAGAKAIRVGDPFAPETTMAALITSADVDRVARLVAEAEEEGASVLCGGAPVAGLAPGGAYFAPTIVDATNTPMLSLLSAEAFGPVVTVQRFRTVEEAIAMANDSEFGLAGGCWTNSLDRALATAKAVDTGMFWVNAYGQKGGAEATLEARRGSGFGPEKGADGAQHYTTSKSVMIKQNPGVA